MLLAPPAFLALVALLALPSPASASRLRTERFDGRGTLRRLERTFDAKERELTRRFTDAEGNTYLASKQLDPEGLPFREERTVGGLQQTLTRCFDGARRLREERGPGSTYRRFDLDEMGRVVAEWDREATTTPGALVAKRWFDDRDTPARVVELIHFRGVLSAGGRG